jgi:hypothetical protein
MKYRKFLIVLLFFPLLVNSQVLFTSIAGKHDSLPQKGKYWFMHTPQIEVIDSGALLPNQTFAASKILIVSAIGGEREGGDDQDMWFTRSIDDGINWNSPKSMCNFADTVGLANVFNGTLYKTPDNIINQLYLWNQAPNGGAFGNFPIFLKKKVSFDGGISWIDSGFVKVKGIPDTTTFRLIGPFCKPIKLSDDSLLFPVYYRIVGSPNAFFAVLKSDLLLNGFSIKLHPQIAYSHPDRLIEPCLVKSNNAIEVYFRSGNGFICTTKSLDEGKTWNSVYKTLIKNSGTLITSIPDNDGLVCSNLNGKIRNNLCIFKDNNDGLLFQEIDYLAEGMEQITYPSMVKDKDGNLHVAYSGIGLDRKAGLRYGNIYFKMVNKVEFNFCPFPADTFKANSLRFSDFAKNGRIGQVWFVNKNKLTKLIQNGVRLEYLIEGVNQIHDLIYLSDNSLLLLTDIGLGEYNLVTKIFINKNATIKAGKFKLLYNNKFIGHFLNKTLNIVSTNDFKVICTKSITSPAFDPSINSAYGNISDIDGDIDNNKIYILTDLGDIYLCDSLCNLSSFRVNTRSGNYVGISIEKDSILLLDKSGNIETINKTNPENGVKLLTTQNSNIYLGFVEISKTKIAIGSNVINIFENGKLILSKYFCETGQIVALIDVDKDSIYFVNSFGEINAISYSLKLTGLLKNKIDYRKSLLVIPNPFTNMANLMFTSGLKPLSLQDLSGKEVKCNFEKIGENNYIFNGTIIPGIYFIKAETNGEVLYIKTMFQ